LLTDQIVILIFIDPGTSIVLQHCITPVFQIVPVLYDSDIKIILNNFNYNLSLIQISLPETGGL